MTQNTFDDQKIDWHKLGDFKYIKYCILDIDLENKIVDVIFKFEAHKQILLHRHKALNKTWVIQGEHYIYKANGDIQEIRPSGSYTSSPASDEPHRECGGDEGAVVLFSIRGEDGVLYEVLDDELNQIDTLSFQDFIDLFEANKIKENGNENNQ